MKNGKKTECAGFAWVLQGGGGHFPGLGKKMYVQ